MGNVEMAPTARVPKKERQELAQYCINLVGLNGFEKALCQLSGGMKQRVESPPT